LLFEHKIVGPFDFADSEQNVPQHVFEVLMDKAPDIQSWRSTSPKNLIFISNRHGWRSTTGIE
jgi:hypothetical protein